MLHNTKMQKNGGENGVGMKKYTIFALGFDMKTNLITFNNTAYESLQL